MKADDQEVDDVLRRALRLDVHDGRALPAPIKQALRAVSMAGVVATVAAVIIVLPLTNRPASAPVLPSSVGVGAGSPSVPAISVAHARIWDLEFHHPASWTVVGSAEAPSELYGNSITALGSVGTGAVVETCGYPSPESSLSGHVDHVCETTWDPSAEVQVRFEWDGRDEAWSAWKAVSGQAPADDMYGVAGMPYLMALPPTRNH